VTLYTLHLSFGYFGRNARLVALVPPFSALFDDFSWLNFVTSVVGFAFDSFSPAGTRRVVLVSIFFAIVNACTKFSASHH